MPEEVTNIQTLKFEPAHLNAAAALYFSAFTRPPWNDKGTVEQARKRLEEIYETRGSMGYVLQDQKSGEIVAVAIGCFESWLDFYNLKEFYVHPDRQNQRLGSKLLETITAEAFRNGARRIYGWTARNSGAEKFWLKMGFVPDSRDIIVCLNNPIGVVDQPTITHLAMPSPSNDT